MRARGALAHGATIRAAGALACLLMAGAALEPRFTLAAGAAAQPVGSIRASCMLASDAAYLRSDVILKLAFTNGAESAVSIDATAFAAGAFQVVDDAGRRVGSQAKEAPAGSEPLTVPGYGTAERQVNLSAWYPGLTSRRRTWQVTWADGPWKAGPIKLVVIQPHDPAKDRVAIIKTDLGTMTWTLLPEYAPEHVRHFVALARQGFYDGLTIFRVVPGIQAEGGDPKGDGTGAWERLMMPEFSTEVKISTGLVGASRRETSMTSDSMFFITLVPAEFMAGKHTFFARLTDGWEVVAGLNRLETTGATGFSDEYLLKQPVKIQSVEIK